MKFWNEKYKSPISFKNKFKAIFSVETRRNVNDLIESNELAKNKYTVKYSQRCSLKINPFVTIVIKRKSKKRSFQPVSSIRWNVNVLSKVGKNVGTAILSHCVWSLFLFLKIVISREWVGSFKKKKNISRLFHLWRRPIVKKTVLRKSRRSEDLLIVFTNLCESLCIILLLVRWTTETTRRKRIGR